MQNLYLAESTQPAGIATDAWLQTVVGHLDKHPSMNNTFGGIWLSVKSNDDYSRHNFIRFENEEIKYFNIDNQHKIELSLIESELSRESLNDCQYEFINADRIRFYKTLGFTYSV